MDKAKCTDNLRALLDFILKKSNKIKFTFYIVKLLLKERGFASHMLSEFNFVDDFGRKFAKAILTVFYKKGRINFSVNIKKLEYEFAFCNVTKK